jgi:hypothetical protein
VGPVRRGPGRPPGTKDSDQKARHLWLAVKLKLGRRKASRQVARLSVDEAGRRVARDLAEIGHEISGSMVCQNYRKVEKLRRSDLASRKQLDGLLAFATDLGFAIPGGAFVPTGFRGKVLEGRVSRMSPTGKLDHRSHFIAKNQRGKVR